jgi:WD40 repeat protein
MRATAPRWFRSAVAQLGIAALLGVSLLPAGLAAAQAGWPDKPSTAEALVAAAHASLATDADRAALLATEAYHLDPSARTHAALLSVVDATVWLDRQLALDGEVTAMASAPTTGEVLAATADGDVVCWDLAGDPRPVGSAGGWVTELVSDTSGAVVAALDAEGTVHLLTEGASRTVFTSALDIALSPTGVLLAALIEGDAGRRLEVTYTGTETVVARLDVGDTYDSVDLGDDFVVLSALDSRLGEQARWERRSLPGLALVREGSVLPDSAFDAGLAATAAVSPYGGSAATVHPLLTTVEDTSDGTRSTMSSDRLPVTLDVRTVVFSPEGTKYLVVRDQKNYLFDLTADGYRELHGALAAETAAFADENRVVTARGRVLTLWDVTTPFPRTTVHSTDFDARERHALSPDGRYLLDAGDEPGGDATNIAMAYDLRAAPDGTDEADDADSEMPGRIAALVDRHGTEDTWLPVVTDDGTTLVVETTDGTVREAGARSSVDELADSENLSTEEFQEIYSPPIRYETGLRDVLGARITSRGELVLAAADGSVRVVDPRTGDPSREATLPGGPWKVAEIAPDGQHVAFSSGATVAVVDTTTGEAAVQLLGIADAPRAPGPVLGFGAGELVVAHPGGVVVLEADGTAVRAQTDAPVPDGLHSVAVLPATGIAVVAGDSPVTVLVDVATGEHVGELNAQVRLPSLTAGTDRLLAVGSDAGNRRVVERDTSARGLLSTACAIAGRDLTAEEWSQVADTPAPPDLSCNRAW